MKNNIQDILVKAIKDTLKVLNYASVYKEDLFLDLPKDNRFGEFTTNIALKLSSLTKKPAFEIAGDIASGVKKYLNKNRFENYVKEVKIEGAGFINFYLTDRYFYEQLGCLVSGKESFAKVNYGKKRRVLIEFVSANPTGPLSVAHARQAAVGDALANILNFAGFRVKREYYLNDEGNQIDILGKSIELRLKELAGETIEFPQNYYQGEYIYDIAREIRNAALRQAQGRPERSRGAESGIRNFSELGVKYILKIIKKELEDFGVKFDYWYSQKKLRKSGKIKKALDFLRQKGFLYEKDGALWFKSTQFGDDKDRVVVKSDGSYTYLAPDIAYHQDKFKRGFGWLINLWGPDHHGYVNRLMAAVEAFGKEPESVSIIIVQLATILRNGAAVQMSTRRGQYITLREILDEVGLDAARFFFLMRRTASPLDFDLDIAKKQTPENPVYYVQYAYARIRSILRNCPKEAKFKGVDLGLLKEKEEIGLIKKIWQFRYVLNICLSTQDPYLLTAYLQELAESFHRFYDLHRVLSEDGLLTKARILLIEATRIVLGQGLGLLGVSRPEKM